MLQNKLNTRVPYTFGTIHIHNGVSQYSSFSFSVSCAPHRRLIERSIKGIPHLMCNWSHDILQTISRPCTLGQFAGGAGAGHRRHLTHLTHLLPPMLSASRPTSQPHDKSIPNCTPPKQISLKEHEIAGLDSVQNAPRRMYRLGKSLFGGLTTLHMHLALVWYSL